MTKDVLTTREPSPQMAFEVAMCAGMGLHANQTNRLVLVMEAGEAPYGRAYVYRTDQEGKKVRDDHGAPTIDIYRVKFGEPPVRGTHVAASEDASEDVDG